MNDVLDGLERLEKAATPGVLRIDGEDILTDGEWGCQSLLCYKKLPLPENEARFRNPNDLAFLVALRNAAPDLIVTIRTLQKEAEDIRGREAGLCYLIHGKEAIIRRQDAELAELRKDKERLDWLDTCKPPIRSLIDAKMEAE